MMNDELGKTRTSKKEFPEKIENIMPGNIITAMIEPCYYKVIDSRAFTELIEELFATF